MPKLEAPNFNFSPTTSSAPDPTNQRVFWVTYEDPDNGDTELQLKLGDDRVLQVST